MTENFGRRVFILGTLSCFAMPMAEALAVAPSDQRSLTALEALFLPENGVAEALVNGAPARRVYYLDIGKMEPERAERLLTEMMRTAS